MPTSAALGGDAVALRRAIAAGPRPRRPNALSASLTHLWRSMLSFKHFPLQLLEVVLFPVIFLLMFTYVFGGAISGSAGEYLQLFVPGILVQTVVLMTVRTGTALNVDLTKGTHDRFRSMPFWQPASVVGNMLSDVVRYLIALSVTLAIGVALGFRPDAPEGVLPALALLAYFAFGISWIFAALGMVASQPETISNTSMIVVFPLVFTSNIFVPESSMPGWMETVVGVNPISHATSAVRGLLHGNAAALDIGLALGFATALIAVFGPLTMRLYARR
ncbi:ABC transporter permease [Spirillospora sp. NPDC047279]|uniref:ABC transporter permease n=1 Tax=Spirillospora sp. NPDC047279 TaxID=3155478 RepID=UPI0033F5BB3E